MDRWEKTAIKNPQEAVKKGLGFITENRKDEGLLLDTSIRENIALPNLSSFSPKGLIDHKREAEFVDLLIKRLTIKTASPNARTPFIRRKPAKSGDSQVDRHRTESAYLG